jgi:hypothetical protein
MVLSTRVVFESVLFYGNNYLLRKAYILEEISTIFSLVEITPKNGPIFTPIRAYGVIWLWQLAYAPKSLTYALCILQVLIWNKSRVRHTKERRIQIDPDPWEGMSSLWGQGKQVVVATWRSREADGLQTVKTEYIPKMFVFKIKVGV